MEEGERDRRGRDRRRRAAGRVKEEQPTERSLASGRNVVRRKLKTAGAAPTLPAAATGIRFTAKAVGWATTGGGRARLSSARRPALGPVPGALRTDAPYR